MGRDFVRLIFYAFFCLTQILLHLFYLPFYLLIFLLLLRELFFFPFSFIDLLVTLLLHLDQLLFKVSYSFLLHLTLCDSIIPSTPNLFNLLRQLISRTSRYSQLFHYRLIFTVQIHYHCFEFGSLFF